MRNNLSKAQSVEVLDTLNNEVTIYSSISEAATFIGCDPTTITKALKNQKEKGASRLLKKRYIVFPKTEESKITDTSAGLKRT